MFLFTSLNIKKKTKKNFALFIFIISLIISLLASLILMIPVIFPDDKVYLAIYLATLDLYIGLGVFVLGLLLIIFIKKVLHKGAL